jgi:hypothetical protein
MLQQAQKGNFCSIKAHQRLLLPRRCLSRICRSLCLGCSCPIWSEFISFRDACLRLHARLNCLGWLRAAAEMAPQCEAATEGTEMAKSGFATVGRKVNEQTTIGVYDGSRIELCCQMGTASDKQDPELRFLQAIILASNIVTGWHSSIPLQVQSDCSKAKTGRSWSP